MWSLVVDDKWQTSERKTRNRVCAQQCRSRSIPTCEKLKLPDRPCSAVGYGNNSKEMTRSTYTGWRNKRKEISKESARRCSGRNNLKISIVASRSWRKNVHTRQLRSRRVIIRQIRIFKIISDKGKEKCVIIYTSHVLVNNSL